MKLSKDFADIPEYNGVYKVNRHGDVLSLKRRSPIILKPSVSRGYLKVSLGDGKKQKKFAVHRLVASVFIGCGGDKFINHKDGNKKNNNLSNLEWVTKKENTTHAMETGLIKKCFSELEAIKILQMKSQKKISNRKLAKMFNVTPTTLNKLINRKSYKTKLVNEACENIIKNGGCLVRKRTN